MDLDELNDRGMDSPSGSVLVHKLLRATWRSALPGGGQGPLDLVRPILQPSQSIFPWKGNPLRALERALVAWVKVAAVAAMVAATLAPAGAVTPPAVWKDSDYPVQPVRWYGIEVAKLPSKTLAVGIERSLRDNGWGPVQLVEKDGGVSVILGEVDTPGRAWYLHEELSQLRVADGRLVEVEPGTSATRGADGPYLPAFLPSPSTAPAKLPTEDEIKERLRSAAESTAGTDSKATFTMLNLWEKKEFGNPEFSDGALAASRLLWKQKSNPEALLYIAGKLARGEWPASPEERLAAGDFVADLLYGYRRDWRGAWSATRTLLDNPLRKPEQKAADMLRMAALTAELSDLKVAPPQFFPGLRSQLRHAMDTLPAEHEGTERGIALVYLQTFAWEGNWPRVEELAADFLKAYPDPSGQNSLARVFLAKSLERRRAFGDAVKELQTVVDTRLADDELLRFGMETVDPIEIARVEKRRFEALAAGLDPMREDPAVGKTELEKFAVEENEKTPDAEKLDSDKKDDEPAKEVKPWYRRWWSGE